MHNTPYKKRDVRMISVPLAQFNVSINGLLWFSGSLVLSIWPLQILSVSVVKATYAYLRYLCVTYALFMHYLMRYFVWPTLDPLTARPGHKPQEPLKSLKSPRPRRSPHCNSEPAPPEALVRKQAAALVAPACSRKLLSPASSFCPRTVLTRLPGFPRLFSC
ncbi:hypothetical protein NDU88_006844 [Pleurodeles waltl]|uniref:Uncharacterized protein n=1 Tax=Pleurodeles waltl TaxID=8319 RepID=A0AAV7VSJ0_PLEWA|nr:hypothetical protein NDU88_006844 [Pleurodeles waltl]